MMMIFTQWHKRLFKRFFYLLIPYSLLRIGFYFYHLTIYRHFTQEEIFESFLMGIRFDVAALCLLNLPFILFSLLPVTNKTILNFERVLFVIVNLIGVSSTINDYELFLFTGKRMSYDFFLITDDIITQLPQLAWYYWPLTLAGLLFFFGLYHFDRKMSFDPRAKFNWRKIVVGGVVVLGLGAVGARGGLQNKSINVQSAFFQGKNELGHLVLNTPYHFLRTLQNQPVVKQVFFKTDDEAKNIILNYRDFRGGVKGIQKANIVLIILESIGEENVEKGYAPFLLELKKSGKYFEKHLANGRRSVESLPALLCGLPSILEEPISKSIFQGNKFSCFPKALKNHGYTNYFFHGGKRGTMGFESYALANGFDRYFAMEDYPNLKDFDGSWGIFDGPYLQYVAQEMDKIKEPFLTGVFTLSSHQPYALPHEFKGKFPKGTLEIHESIGYVDYSLREFFKAIGNKPWFKRTLFIITADHSQILESKKFENIVGHYRVPLIFYAPGYEWENVNLDKVTQHSDIPSSILDFVRVEDEEVGAIGVSVFSKDAGMALNYESGRSYVLLRENKVLTIDKNNEQIEYLYHWETGELDRVGPNDGPELRAYLQYFMNGLINNNLSLYR